MSPRCTLIGAATSPTTIASATAGLVTIQTSLKMNIKLKKAEAQIATLHKELEAKTAALAVAKAEADQLKLQSF